MANVQKKVKLKRKIILLIIISLLIISNASAHTIKGSVIDKKTKEPLAGAIVTIGNQRVTITDKDGFFNIKTSDTKDNETALLVSLLGYKSELVNIAKDANGGITTISLQLSEDIIDDLSSIVNKTPDNKSTISSIGTIDADVLEQNDGKSIVESLQGRVAGLVANIDGNGTLTTTSIQIRGKNSLNSNGTPLFIVDGVPFPVNFISTSTSKINPLSGINPSNIESIQILKDADATSIYGSKGADGVVIINTKKRYTDYLRIDADASIGFSKITSNLDFVSTEEYLNIREKAFAADNITPTKTNAYDILLWGNQYHTDWQKVLFGNTANVYNGQLNMSGGTGQTNFSFNGGVYQTGTTYLEDNDDKFRRINGRLSIQHTGFENRLSLSGTVLYSSTTIENTGLQPGSFLSSAPNQPLYNDDGSVYWVPDNASFTTALRHKYVNTENKLGSFIGNFSLSYKVLKDLEIKTDFGYTRTDSKQFSSYANGYLNPYAANSYKNIVYNTKSSTELFSVEPQLNYSKIIGEGRLGILLGTTFQGENYEESTNQLRDFPAEALFRNSAAATTKYSITSGSSQYRYASLFGRLSYDFRKKYFANAVFRRDGSSRFYKDNRFGNFWSLGAAWIFNRESFLAEHLSFLSYGKLRGSYGTTGNDNVGNYQYLETYATSTYPYASNTGIYSDQVANKDFKWEVTKKAEIGLELGFFNQNLLINTSFYRNRSDNLLVAYPLPTQTGFSAYRRNLNALIQNQGIEIELVSTNIKKRDFRWSTSFNITIPENKLLKYPNIKESSFATTYAVGKSLNVTRLYEYTGIDPNTGAPTVRDINDDGQITSADDKVFLKDEDPDYYGGLSNTFRYKSLQLDIFFQFVKRPFKRGYLSNFYYPIGYQGKGILKELASDYWTPENTNAKYPGLTTTTSSTIGYAYYYYYTESDAVYTDASFIRLKNLSLSYNLPKDILTKTKIRDVRFYVRAQNLFTIAKFNSWDPETGNAIPPARTITLGTTISF